MRAIYVLTSAKLYGLCLRVCCGDDNAASEALQNTYIAIWRSAGSYRAGRSSPITWFSAIARNAAIDQLRKVNRHTSRVGEYEIESIADDRPSAEQALIQAQAISALEIYIARLSSSDAALVHAVFDEHLTYPAIAERLGLSLAAVKSRVRRILLVMRAELSHQIER